MGHSLPESLDAAASRFGLLLARVDGVAHAAGFDLDLFDRARNLEHRLAGGAGGFGVGVHDGVDGGLHSPGRLQEFLAGARGVRVPSFVLRVLETRNPKLAHSTSSGQATRNLPSSLPLPLRFRLLGLRLCLGLHFFGSRLRLALRLFGRRTLFRPGQSLGRRLGEDSLLRLGWEFHG